MYKNYKNLIINIMEEPKDFLGSSSLEFPGQILLDYLDDEFGEWNLEDIESIQYGSEHVINWLIGKREDEFITYDTDLQILLFNYLLDQYERHEVTYYGKVFWVYHDLKHAENDVIGSDIFVNADIEEERIFQALDELKERDEMNEFTFQMLEEITSSFKQRWDYNFDEERVREDYLYEEELFEYE